MPATSPAIKAETWAERPDTRAAQGAKPDCCGAPSFALLDLRGTSPWALALSCGCLSGLLSLAVILDRPLSARRPSGGEISTEIMIRSGPLWPPKSPPLLDSRPRAMRAIPPVEPAHPVTEPFRPSAPIQAAKAAAKADLPAAVLPESRLGVLPLPAHDAVSHAFKLKIPTGAMPVRAADSPQPGWGELGVLPLPRLIGNEAALAASFAALTPDERRALPRVTIRVNAEWLEALPETGEKLYFSVTPPQNTDVLTYRPVTHSFNLERPQHPLWQIRDGDRVPALEALRAAAARRLGVPAELVGLYTWHPNILEEALRMFVLERMRQQGVQLGPRGLVTVRIESAPDGFVMNLEPIRDGGSQ